MHSVVRVGDDWGTSSRAGSVYFHGSLNGRMLCCYFITPSHSTNRGDSVGSLLVEW